MDDDDDSLSQPLIRPGKGDVIDRGVVSLEKATELFRRYTDGMAHHLPAVVFPPGITVDEMRRNHPVTFLSILSAAASQTSMLQSKFQTELMAVFGYKVFMTGEKNIDVVQALIIAVSWYFPPEQFEEIKFYQMIHLAAVMAIDIGLGRSLSPHANGSLSDRIRSVLISRRSLFDPSTAESRRTWLACYYLTCNTAISLHRTPLVRWTSFMTESVELLSAGTLPGSAPTDKYFCQLVLQHKVGEDIALRFSIDDPMRVVDISDTRTLFSLRALERNLDTYWRDVAKDLVARESLPTPKLVFFFFLSK